MPTVKSTREVRLRVQRDALRYRKGENCNALQVETARRFCSVDIITALHVMQTRYCDENSVCPSVRPSVTHVDCDKTVERSVQIYIPYERTFSLVF